MPCAWRWSGYSLWPQEGLERLDIILTWRGEANELDLSGKAARRASHLFEKHHLVPLSHKKTPLALHSQRDFHAFPMLKSTRHHLEQGILSWKEPEGALPPAAPHLATRRATVDEGLRSARPPAVLDVAREGQKPHGRPSAAVAAPGGRALVLGAQQLPSGAEQTIHVY